MVGSCQKHKPRLPYHVELNPRGLLTGQPTQPTRCRMYLVSNGLSTMPHDLQNQSDIDRCLHTIYNAETSGGNHRLIDPCIIYLCLTIPWV